MAFWLGKNWGSLSGKVSQWSISEYTLLKDFIGAIFSWPIVTLILVSRFFSSFPKGINSFLENSRIKTPFTDNTNEDSQEIPTTPIQVENTDEKFDFGFLTNFLKDHTKDALKWIGSNNPYIKDFYTEFVLTPTFTDKKQELRNVVNVLCSFGLTVIDGRQKISITPKGNRFLEMINPLPKT